MAHKKNKKPDQIVFDEATQKYDAAIKPYSTNLGAPAIEVEDITSWKNNNVHKVNHHFKSKFETLKKEYESMMEHFEYNNLIYSAKFSFEPIVGELYHLYRDQDGKPFLSIISPKECTWDFVGSFQLTTEKLWEKIG